ncbi:AMP-binding protein [Roseomonas sp. KE0001]|uniref:AMP-binding protein n=1 Tax=Roseomonas sp. KE0001 TaxID=2479201 RepID=UPI0018DF2A2B|nr:AMP-binding protein [Roseomonas sp. KE0001]MBI0432282.1 acyl-CoA synthetase [Roseomonas sp. KE0001]
MRQTRMHQTLTALLDETAAAVPEAPALAFLDGPALSYAGFAAAVRRVAGGLARQGIGAGDRVAIWLPNRPEYLILHFALARLGATAIHVNTRFRAQEVAYLLDRARPVAIATQWGFAAGDFPALLGAVLPDLAAPPRCVIGLDTAETRLGALPVLPWAALDATSGQAEDAASPGASPESDCLTFTTSGTTSGPKLVLHRQRSIAHHAGDVARRLGLDAPRRGGRATLLAVVPLCGTFGLMAALGAVAGGAEIVCQDRFDPAVTDRLLRARRVTHTIGADDMIYRLAEVAAGRPYPDLRFTGFASFSPGAARVLALSDALNLHARGLYGSSELLALFAIQEETDAERRGLGGGLPLSPRAECRIREGGERGELECRAPSMFAGYLDDPGATAKALTTDGFYRTGDLCRLRAEGGFDYESRLGDALRLGGFLVSPEEIEAFLKALPGVDNAQVVGLREASMAVAFVTPRPGATLREADLAAACRARLARYKQPARILPLDAFPVTESPNGVKIQRVRLREMAEALMADTEGATP